MLTDSVSRIPTGKNRNDRPAASAKPAFRRKPNLPKAHITNTALTIDSSSQEHPPQPPQPLQPPPQPLQPVEQELPPLTVSWPKPSVKPQSA